jgi:hypothetical protein
MDDFVKSVECYYYFVLGSDSSCNVYKSLREIQDDISVDYSTISKKLKEDNTCFVTPKGSETHYYIKKFR